MCVCVWGGGAERQRHNGNLENEWEKDWRRKGGVRAAVTDKTDWRSSPTHSIQYETKIIRSCATVLTRARKRSQRTLTVHQI